MATRSSIIPAIAILVVVIGIIAYMLMRGEGNMVINQTPEVSPSESGVWPSEEVRTESVNDSGRGYKITAVYPVTSSDTVTTYFRTFVDETIAQFKTDTAWVADIENPEENAVALDITYTREKGMTADNYVFLLAMYTGGAHGLQATKTFTFAPDGTPVTVEMLFTNETDGLKTIAPLVQKELMKREFAEEGWVTDGTAPTEQNYKNFTVTDAGLTFIFDPYHVASYAAGMQKVTIPLSAFKKIANTEVFGN
ncbi:MAG TPA: RsiV family protein [Candidatus Paceibacterota bacterium]